MCGHGSTIYSYQEQIRRVTGKPTPATPATGSPITTCRGGANKTRGSRCNSLAGAHEPARSGGRKWSESRLRCTLGYGRKKSSPGVWRGFGVAGRRAGAATVAALRARSNNFSPADPGDQPPGHSENRLPASQQDLTCRLDYWSSKEPSGSFLSRVQESPGAGGEGTSVISGGGRAGMANHHQRTRATSSLHHQPVWAPQWRGASHPKQIAWLEKWQRHWRRSEAKSTCPDQRDSNNSLRQAGVFLRHKRDGGRAASGGVLQNPARAQVAQDRAGRCGPWQAGVPLRGHPGRPPPTGAASTACLQKDQGGALTALAAGGYHVFTGALACPARVSNLPPLFRQAANCGGENWALGKRLKHAAMGDRGANRSTISHQHGVSRAKPYLPAGRGADIAPTHCVHASPVGGRASS